MADTLRDDLQRVAQSDIDELVKKDAEYGSSWKRRGGVGAYMMLARKIDRIEQQVKAHGWDIFAAATTDTRAEGIRDDIGDLRRYLMLVETEIRPRETAAAGPRRFAPTLAAEGLRKELVQPWICPQEGDRVWDDLHKRYGTVTEVLQDGDAGIRFDNGKPPYQSKWSRMWVLLDQTPPHAASTGQEHPFGYQSDDD